jgi:hypothetical protein
VETRPRGGRDEKNADSPEGILIVSIAPDVPLERLSIGDKFCAIVWGAVEGQVFARGGRANGPSITLPVEGPLLVLATVIGVPDDYGKGEAGSAGDARLCANEHTGSVVDTRKVEGSAGLDVSDLVSLTGDDLSRHGARRRGVGRGLQQAARFL